MTDEIIFTGKYTSPRKAKQFGEQFDTPGESVLLRGDDDFPDTLERQRHYVGVIIDASIILHIYERLKEGAGIGDLASYFPLGVTEEETKKLVGKVEDNVSAKEREKRDEERLQTLVDMSKEDPGDLGIRRILNRRALVNDATWNTFMAQETHYWENGPFKEGTTPDTWPKRPDDPRIAAAARYISSTIGIIDPGPKTPHSMHKKMKDKGWTSNRLQDQNRALISPKHPEYAFDFAKIVSRLFPDKEFEENGEKVKIPQIFIPRVEVFNYGYCAQYMKIAVDRRRKSEKGEMLPTEGRRAIVVELKVVAPKMMPAEINTGIIKGLGKDCSEPTLYTSDGTDKRRKMLQTRFQEVKREYENLLTPGELHDKRFQFPSFPVTTTSAKSGLDNKMATEIRRKTYLIIAEHLNMPAASADTPVGHLVLGTNSFIGQLQQTFNIDITNADRRRFKTSEDVAGFIIEQESARAYTNLRRQLTQLRDGEGFPTDDERTQQIVIALEPLLDMLKKPFLYTFEGMMQRRNYLEQKYTSIKGSYEALQTEAEKKNKDYNFPPFTPRARPNNESEYKQLGEEITKLQKTINYGAATTLERDWRTEYLKAVIFQQEYVNSGSKVKNEGTPNERVRLKGIGREVAKYHDLDVERYDVIIDPILKQIANGVGTLDAKGKTIYPDALSLDTIRSQLRIEVNQAHWHEKNTESAIAR